MFGGGVSARLIWPLASVVLLVLLVRSAHCQESEDEWLAVINNNNKEPETTVEEQRIEAPRPLPPMVRRQDTLTPPRPLRRGPPVAQNRDARPPPPPPQANDKGVLAGIGDAITGAVSGAVEGVTCAATTLYTEDRLKDKAYMDYQLRCMLGEGECDKLGNLIKRMAPDILRGGCPPPCDPCIKKEIQRVMSTVSRQYPREWQRMMKQFG